MYFNFEENHPDTPRLASSLTVLERVLLTAVIYLVAVILVLVIPKTEWYKARLLEQQKALEQRIVEQIRKERENARFVFMSPRVDIQAPKPPPVAELSDIDRRASSPQRAADPKNPLPFARGNSPERIDSQVLNGPRDVRPEPPAAPPAKGESEATPSSVPLIESPNAANARQQLAERPQTRGTASGVLADAIRNVQKYAGSETFHNPQGGAPDENFPSIQFDAKGVEFGPWLRRFVAQIRRNWFIPYAAMTMKGHVVVTFYVHKDGRITDLQVLKPSSVDAFTRSAFNALAASNPTAALPPEYPDEKAFFTVTFYFNETPPR
jgi:TonB family protein